MLNHASLLEESIKGGLLILECDYRLKWSDKPRLLLTWSLGSLFGGRVLAFGLDGGRVEDPRGGAVLAEVILQAFDGAIQLAGPDLEVDVHEICRGERRVSTTALVQR